eukprot:c8862_g1_i2.p1 GENE.c8862_g1_i2~~c8862_g1_i2.p1  ORF type:complete len:476 (-),score=130.26 c8862_g1_i2:8-1435(-)
MIKMFKLDFVPGAASWVYDPKHDIPLVAVSDANSSKIYIFDAITLDKHGVVKTIEVHSTPVTAMRYNVTSNVVISADSEGIVEYWSPSTPNGDIPAGTTKFQFKSETSLFTFAEKKAVVYNICVSKDGSLFATTSSDMIVRIFRFATGKLIRAYDESLEQANRVQRSTAPVNPYKLDNIDFGRRSAVEKELLKSPRARLINVVFDETGNFIIYPTILGIKIVNIKSNQVKRLLGKVENTDRFLSVALYQGRPRVNIYSPIPETEDDPTVVCAAFKKNRFFLFSRREPDEESDLQSQRDVFNEKPSKAELMAAKPANNPLGQTAVIHTTLGDIAIKLFPEECPKTVENFSTHAKNGYYNNMIFHRVIKGFMVQTGDPLGDGTGGASIWGKDFEDEIHRDLRHDRPFTVSMANAGPNTNGSQFFITTQPAQWLDGKHTVFGRVIKGMDVVTKIEKLKVDKYDKPIEPPKMINIDITE